MLDYVSSVYNICNILYITDEGMRLILTILAVALYTAPSAATAKDYDTEIIFDGESITVDAPIDDLNHAPVLILTVDNHDPYRFLVDTGSEHNYVSDKFIEELRLKEIEHTKKTFVMPNETVTLQQHTVLLPESKVGPITFKNLQLNSIVDKNYEIKMFKKNDIDGILGMYTFSDVAIEVDYAQKKISLSKEKLEDTGKNIYKFARRINMPFLQAEIDFKHIQGDFFEHILLDTGYFGGIFINSCNHPAMQAVHIDKNLQLIGEFGSDLIHHFAKLKGKIILSNEYVLKDPPIAFATVNCNTKPHGLIGSDFFKNHIVKIDQRSRLVRISPTSQEVVMME